MSANSIYDLIKTDFDNRVRLYSFIENQKESIRDLHKQYKDGLITLTDFVDTARLNGWHVVNESTVIWSEFLKLESELPIQDFHESERVRSHMRQHFEVTLSYH